MSEMDRQTMDCHASCKFKHNCGTCHLMGDSKPVFISMADVVGGTAVYVVNKETVNIMVKLPDGATAPLVQVTKGIIRTNLEV